MRPSGSLMMWVVGVAPWGWHHLPFHRVRRGLLLSAGDGDSEQVVVVDRAGIGIRRNSLQQVDDLRLGQRFAVDPIPHPPA